MILVSKCGSNRADEKKYVTLFFDAMIWAGVQR